MAVTSASISASYVLVKHQTVKTICFILCTYGRRQHGSVFWSRTKNILFVLFKLIPTFQRLEDRINKSAKVMVKCAKFLYRGQVVHLANLRFAWLLFCWMMYCGMQQKSTNHECHWWQVVSMKTSSRHWEPMGHFCPTNPPVLAECSEVRRCLQVPIEGCRRKDGLLHMGRWRQRRQNEGKNYVWTWPQALWAYSDEDAQIEFLMQTSRSRKGIPVSPNCLYSTWWHTASEFAVGPPSIFHSERQANHSADKRRDGCKHNLTWHWIIGG